MRGEHWIERHRSARVLDVAQRLGLTVFRSRGASGGSMACPACGAARRHSKAGDKRGAAGVRREGNGWRCFQCDASGDALDAVAYALVGRRLRNADADQRAAVRAWLDEEHPATSFAPPVATLPPLEYPDPQELRVFFEELIRADDDPQAAAYLRGRGIDPAEVEARTLAAVVLGKAEVPRFARIGAKRWSETDFRLILPLFDAQGRARSCLARRLKRGGPKDMKSTAAVGYARGGLVLANARARSMLSAWRTPGSLRVVITEGEIDFLTAACEEPEATGPAVLGVLSGSWSEELAARIPDGARVIIATHNDPPGDKYAATIADSLFDRPVTLMRWSAAS